MKRWQLTEGRGNQILWWCRDKHNAELQRYSLPAISIHWSPFSIAVVLRWSYCNISFIVFGSVICVFCFSIFRNEIFVFLSIVVWMFILLFLCHQFTCVYQHRLFKMIHDFVHNDICMIEIYMTFHKESILMTLSFNLFHPWSTKEVLKIDTTFLTVKQY